MTDLQKKVEEYMHLVMFPINTYYYYYNVNARIVGTQTLNTWGEVFKRFKIDNSKNDYILTLHPKWESENDKKGIRLYFLVGKSEDVDELYEDYKNNPSMDLDAAYEMNWISFNDYMDESKLHIVDEEQIQFVTISYIKENKKKTGKYRP